MSRIGLSLDGVEGGWTDSVVYCCRYYSGSLELPIINGPTEGILIGIALKLFTAAVGVDFWNREMVEGVQNNSLFVIVTMISSCFTLMVKYVIAFLLIVLLIVEPLIN